MPMAITQNNEDNRFLIRLSLIFDLCISMLKTYYVQHYLKLLRREEGRQFHNFMF